MTVTALPINNPALNTVNTGASIRGATALIDAAAAFSLELSKAKDAGAMTGPAPVTVGPNDTAKASGAINMKAQDGVFRTVYDPVTGREFVSPIQAVQFGVTGYVDTLPADFPLPNSLKGMSFQQIEETAKPFGLTADELIKKERQGALLSADALTVRAAVANESNGLSPSQLVAKLQAYKTNPPATAKDFLEQQGLWADYANRYASSSWNYANMDGKPQDHSLKPANTLQMQFTGYAAPINQMLSAMNQQSPEFQAMSKTLQKYPEIDTLVNQLYSINPEQSFFNALNPKLSGGTPDAIMANNFASSIKSLVNEMDTFGKEIAARQFLGRQQDLLAFLPDENGHVGNFNQASMSNPQYRAIQQLGDQFTVKTSDEQWMSQAALGVPADSTASMPVRDPESGKGVALQYGSNGQPEAIRLYDAAGAAKVVYNDPAKLVEAVYATGTPLSAFDALAKQVASDVLIPEQPGLTGSSNFPPGLKNGVKLSDVASGKLAQVVASDDWLNFQIADVKSKNTQSVNYAGGLNNQMSKIKNQNVIAKAYCNELKLGAGATSSNSLAQVNAAAPVMASNLVDSSVDSLLGLLEAQLSFGLVKPVKS